MSDAIPWRPLSEFPRDGRTVLHWDGRGMEFARWEPEGGCELKIVSPLGGTQLAHLFPTDAGAWVDLYHIPPPESAR